MKQHTFIRVGLRRAAAWAVALCLLLQPAPAVWAEDASSAAASSAVTASNSETASSSSEAASSSGEATSSSSETASSSSETASSSGEAASSSSEAASSSSEAASSSSEAASSSSETASSSSEAASSSSEAASSSSEAASSSSEVASSSSEAASSSGEADSSSHGAVTFNLTAPRAPSYSGGTGSEDDPYLLANYDDLAALAAAVNGGESYQGSFFKLADGFPSGGTATAAATAIGTQGTQFKGSFNGSGKTVQLAIDAPTLDYQGLFGYVGAGGTVQNLTVAGTVTGKDAVGGIAGGIASSLGIQRCVNTAAVTGQNAVGGIVGRSWSTVENCVNTASVKSTNNFAGGIVGQNSNGPSVVRTCYNTGAVTAMNSIVGGIVGMNYGSDTVQGCVSLGPVVTGHYAEAVTGRVVGQNAGALADNRARADLKTGKPDAETVPNKNLGADKTNGEGVDLGTAYGAVFSGWDQSVWNIDAAGALAVSAALPTLNSQPGMQAPTLPAGPLGGEDNPYLLNNYEDLADLAAKVNAGEAYAGKYFKLADGFPSGGTATAATTAIGVNLYQKNFPFQGSFDGNGKTVQLAIDAPTLANQGLFGYVGAGGTVKNVVTAGFVNGKGTVGGVVGYNIQGTVENCSNTAAVTGESTVGGIVGNSNANKAAMRISGCTNSGAVTATGKNGGAGGIAGRASGLKTTGNVGVENCVNSGAVSGGMNVGGIVGYNLCTMKSCYNTGSVTAKNRVGGVVGANMKDGSYYGIVTNCYNTGDVEGTDQNGFVGGVAGTASSNTRIQNCYNTGSVRGLAAVGGIVGWRLAGIEKLNGCVSLGSVVTGEANTGRVAGLNETGTGESSKFYGNAARADMWIGPVGAEAEPTENKEAGKSNGADLALGTAYSAVFSGWDQTAWNIDPAGTLTVGAGLPTLKNVAAAQSPTLPKAPADFEGEGTQAAPYLLKNYGDLAKLAVKVNGGKAYPGQYFKLDAGFPSGGTAQAVTTAIGTSSAPFKGSFDGNGKTVQLAIDAPAADYQGLFGKIGTGGTVQNVVTAGFVNGKNCVGGIAGFFDGTVKSCVNTATVTGMSTLGGIAGYSGGGTVENCVNTAAVTAAGEQVGGIVGQNFAAVTACYNTGAVTAAGGDPLAGGIVGRHMSPSKQIVNCVSLGLTVTGQISAWSETVGRVAGQASENALAQNRARADQLIGPAGAEAAPTTRLGADKANGAGVALGTAYGDVFSGWDTSVWAFDAGAALALEAALPTLKSIPEMQAPTLPKLTKRDVSAQLSVTQADITYGAAPAPQGSFGGTASGTGTWQYTYSINGTDFNNVAPEQAGTYTVKAVYEDDAQTGEATAQFTIAPKELTVTGLAATSRAYDGTTDVALTGGALDGKVDGDDVSLPAALTGAMADKNVGKEKPVTVDTVTLAGADKENYTLTLPTDITVDIAPKAVTVTISGPASYILGGSGYRHTASYPAAGGDTPDATVLYGGSETPPTALGTYALTARVNDGNYTAAGVTGVERFTILAPVTLTGTDRAVTYTPEGVDVSALFRLDANAGAATYTAAPGTNAAGALGADGKTLAVTACGTFTVTVNTAATATHAAGAATATLTVNKATPDYTAPTGLKAVEGQTLADVALPQGFAWEQDVTTPVGAAGERGFTVRYTPENTACYTQVLAIPVTVTVTAAATPVLPGPEPTTPVTPTTPTTPTVPAVPTAPQQTARLGGTQTRGPGPAQPSPAAQYRGQAEKAVFPEGLPGTEYETAAALEQALRETMAKDGYKAGDVAFYNITLQRSTDGENWTALQGKNVPEKGLAVLVPYPDGTDGEGFDFAAAYLVTQDGNGLHAGDLEPLQVTKTQKGLQVLLTDDVLLALAWKPAQQPAAQAASSSAQPAPESAPTQGEEAQPAQGGSPAPYVAVGGGALVLAGLLAVLVKKRRGK